MSVARSTPFELVFAALATERFPVLQRAISAAGTDPGDRDGFLMVRDVVELLHEMRPDEGLGQAMSGAASFLHYGYLYWLDGRHDQSVEDHVLSRALSESPAIEAAASQSCAYVQLPPFVVWGEPIEGGLAEPLDGWFIRREGNRLGVLAIFGLHPGRPGFSAVEVAGERPVLLERLDGSPLFTPTLPGGRAAGLASVAGAEELLELAWRIEALAGHPARIPA